VQLQISRSEIHAMVARQLESLFVLDRGAELPTLSRGIDEALGRCEYCFSHTDNKYYHRGAEVYFNPFHSGQYSIFLYYLANSVFLEAQESNTLSDRIYSLNRCLSGVDLFYEVMLPRVFFLDHPLGSVIGRAVYGDFFGFAQQCTVGNNRGVYPTIGRNVRMKSGSKIVGDCTIGDDVIIAANSYVKDADVPSCSLVFGQSPNLVFKSVDQSYFAAEPRGL